MKQSAIHNFYNSIKISYLLQQFYNFLKQTLLL